MWALDLEFCWNQLARIGPGRHSGSQSRPWPSGWCMPGPVLALMGQLSLPFTLTPSSLAVQWHTPGPGSVPPQVEVMTLVSFTGGN